jgi:hypothetical protein
MGEKSEIQTRKLDAEWENPAQENKDLQMS